MISPAGGSEPVADRMVIQEMMRIRDLVARLEGMLPEKLSGDPAVRAVFDDLSATLSRASSMLDSGSGKPQEAQGDPDSGMVSSAGKRKFAQVEDGNPRGGRRRLEPSILRQVTARNLNDGQTWRKYGQKDIQNHKHPRSYFRCTHRNDQGCKAIRQVQLSEEDPSTYIITYMGEHTCKDPATVPGFMSPSNLDQLRLISFATNTTTTTIPNHFLSIKRESDDEVLSNITYGSSSSDFCAPLAAEVSAENSTLAAAPISDHGDISSCLISPADNLDMDFMEDIGFDLSDVLDDFFLS